MIFIDEIRSNKLLSIFVIYLRYLIGGAFVFASIVKVNGERFMALDGTKDPINSPAHFFETLYQSGFYWKFLGITQLIAGFLLMTQRFATIGALVFFPIILNIFVITISYDFHGTPFITGLMLLANTFLLLWEYEKLLPLLNGNFQPKHNIKPTRKWVVAGISMFVLSIVYPVFSRNPLAWFMGCTAIAIVPLFIYNKNAEKV